MVGTVFRLSEEGCYAKLFNVAIDYVYDNY